MKIEQWDVGDNPHNKGGVMVTATEQEAIKIINSLSHQLASKDKRREFFDDKGKAFSIGIAEGEASFDDTESSSCNECPGDGQMSDNEVSLGGCYHTGLAYSLGYDANGEVELVGETFTNLDIGVDGGAMAALRKHREQFDPSHDIKRFIVAMRPVAIISGLKEDEDYTLEGNAGCDFCGTHDRIDGETLCKPCLENMCQQCREQFMDCDCGFVDEVHCRCLCNDTYDCDHDTCDDCGEWVEYCICDDDDEPCDCGDEFCEEFVADRFKPMNAFARARWLQAKGKI